MINSSHTRIFILYTLGQSGWRVLDSKEIICLFPETSFTFASNSPYAPSSIIQVSPSPPQIEVFDDLDIAIPIWINNDRVSAETLEEHNHNPFFEFKLKISYDTRNSSWTDTTPLDKNRLGPQQYIPQTYRLGRGMWYKIPCTHLKPYVTYSA